MWKESNQPTIYSICISIHTTTDTQAHIHTFCTKRFFILALTNPVSWFFMTGETQNVIRMLICTTNFSAEFLFVFFPFYFSISSFCRVYFTNYTFRVEMNRHGWIHCWWCPSFVSLFRVTYIITWRMLMGSKTFEKLMQKSRESLALIIFFCVLFPFFCTAVLACIIFHHHLLLFLFFHLWKIINEQTKRGKRVQVHNVCTTIIKWAQRTIHTGTPPFDNNNLTNNFP